jgi:hypothetical protein
MYPSVISSLLLSQNNVKNQLFEKEDIKIEETITEKYIDCANENKINFHLKVMDKI